MSTDKPQARAARFSIPSLAQIFWGPLAKRIRRIAQWRRHGLLGKSSWRQRQMMRFEALEPRLLLSADLPYTATTSVTEFTLKAEGGNVLNLYDYNTSTSEGSAALGTGNVDFTIERGQFLGVPQGFNYADKIHLDLDSFSANLSGITALNVTFDGGDQRLNQDSVVLDGTAGHNLPFSLSVTSNSTISSIGTVDVTGDLTLQSKATATNFLGQGVFANANTGITLDGANFKASGNMTLTADSTVSVSTSDADGSHKGDVSSIGGTIQNYLDKTLGANNTGVSLVTSFSQAKIEIDNGSQLAANGGNLEITSSVDGSIDANTTKSPDPATISVAIGQADPEVLIHGALTKLSASSKIDATATTNFTKFNVEATSKGNSSTSADGAVAVAVFDAGATLSVYDGATVSGTGATTLSASSTLPLTTKGDASTGGTAGAGVAASVVFGDTAATINGATVDGSSVTLQSSSTRTLTTTADSSGAGSSSNSGKNTSENTLSQNNASTSDGSISIAGAVAFTYDGGTTSAFVNDSTIDAGSGALTVSATPQDTASTTADASFTNSTTGVAVAVAIDIADRTNLAYVSGTTGITAGALTIEVLAPNQSSFSAQAISGVSSSDTGFAGSLAINVAITDNEAYIADGAQLTLSGNPNVTIEADSNIKNTDKATPTSGGASGGSTGVGASVAFNYGEDTTAGYIGKDVTLTGADALSLTAKSQHSMSTTAQNGASAKSSGGDAVTPVVAISVADDDAHATVGSSSTDPLNPLTIGGDFNAKSTLTDSVQTTATGNTTAADVGFGVSIALAIVKDDSTASTSRDLASGGVAAFMSSAISGSETTAKASTKGAQDKSKDSSTADQKKDKQQGYAADTAKSDGAKKSGDTKSAQSPSASSSDGSVDVAGAIAVNIENASSVASIPDGRHITATKAVSALSSGNADGHALADGSATTLSGGTGVGIGVAVNVSNITNLGYVGNGAVVSGGGLNVGATMADRAIKAPVLGTPSVVTLDNSTDTTFQKDSIYLGLNSGLKTGDEVKYDANSGSAIAGLTDSKSYYVNVAGDGSVRLYGDGSGNGNGLTDAQSGSGNFIKLTSTSGTASQDKFYKYVSGSPDTKNPFVFSPGGKATATVVSQDDDPSASLFQKDSIYVGLDSGLKSGDQVAYYNNGNTSIGGLDSDLTGLIHSYYVNVANDGTVRFYDSKAHAEAGGDDGLVKLTSAGSGTEQWLGKFVTVSSVSAPNFITPIKFNPTGTMTLLNLGSSSQLRTGDAVKYDANKGTALGGLTDSDVYYIIDLSGGRYELAASRDDAYSGKAIALSGTAPDGEKVHDLTDSSRADATSGASGGDIGIGVSVAVNVVTNDTEAVVGLTPGLDTSGTAKIDTSGGDSSVSAASDEANLATAKPHGDAGGDNAGVGASVAVNVLTNTVTSNITDGTAWSGTVGKFTDSASSGDSAITHAENGAKGSDAFGIGAAVLVAQDTTTAHVGTDALSGSGISGSGDVSITAAHTGDFKTTTDAEAAGKNVGVGASVSVAVVIENISAQLARSVTTSGAFTLSSSSTVAVDTEAVATVKGEDSSGKSSSSGKSQSSADGQAEHQVNDNSNTKTKSFSSSAGSSASNGQNSTSSEGSSDNSGVGVAAAVSVNVLTSHNSAKITNGADVTAGKAVTIGAYAEDDATAKGVGAAIAMDNSTNIGAGVGLNVVNATNDAYVDAGGSTIQGNGITIEAITPVDPNTKQSKTDDFVAWGAAAAANGNNATAAIAGSVGINVINTFDTKAYTVSGSHLESSGAINVTANAYLDPQTLAAAAGFSQGGDAIGATINVAVLHASTTAYIGGDADAAGAITIDAENHLLPSKIILPVLNDGPQATSVAVAGSASGGDAAVAGSFIVNDIHVDADAHIGASSQINQDGLYTPTSGQTITVEAVNETQITSVAGALGLTTGSAGIGIGLDVEILHKTTKAYIDTGAQVDAGGTIGITADSSETMLSIAGTIGVGTDGAAVAASISIADIHTETDAYIADPTAVEAGGTITIAATSTFLTTMIAGAVGVGDSAGIGVSNTTLVHTATTQAYIGGGAVVSAGGTISITATASEDILSIAAGFAAGGDAGVAGSAAVNVLDETTSAYVGPSATITTTNLGDLAIGASDDTSVISVAGSIGASGTAGVGIGAAVGVFTKSTNAYIDSGVTATVAGNITVGAKSTEDLISVSAGLGAGEVGVAANADVNVFTLETRAFIGDDPTDSIASAGAGDVHASGSIGLAADDETNINEVTAVAAFGVVGVGAAAGVNVMNKDTEAFIGAGAKVSGDGQGSGIDVNTGQIGLNYTNKAGFDTSDPTSQGIETSSADKGTLTSGNHSSFKSQGQLGTPQVAPMHLNGDSSEQNVSDDSLDPTKYRTASPDTQSGFHGVAIAATNQDEIRTFTFSIAGGEVGVAVSAGVDVVDATTRAYIGNGASVNQGTDPASLGNAQSVLVGAGDDFYHLAVAGSAAGGIVGVGPAVGVNVVNSTTQAFIDNNAKVNARNDILVGAAGSENVVMIGFGIGGGVVGVGGAVDVLSIGNHTTAYIGDSAYVYSGGDVFLSATDDTHVLELTGALAGGLVGVGGSVGVMLINKDTEATIGNSHVDALGKTGGESNLLDGKIVSGPSFETTSAHGVILQAQSSEELLHIVAAGAGGFVGVSGAVGVTLISGKTLAEIHSGAQIDTLHQGSANSDQSVYVNASDDVSVQTFIIGVAGGFVGVSGAVDVGTINDNVTAQVAGTATVNALQDIEINALSLKDVQGFDLSGAGGFVGVGGAVSVWSVGTSIQKTTKDQDGNSTNSALDGGSNGSADSNAGAQAETGTGQVTNSGGGGINNFSSGSNPNSNQSRIHSAAQTAIFGDGGKIGGINSEAPNQSTVTGAETAAPAGTTAQVDSGVHLTAGGHIGVKANETDTIQVIGGQAAGGFVGAGASVAIMSIGDNVTAFADGTLSAGGNIDVDAILNEHVHLTVLDAAGGFVGIGAAVAVVNDTSLVQASLGNVIKAGDVSVSASNNRDVGPAILNATTGQVSTGAVGVGASFTRLAITGGASATVDGAAQIGQSGTVKSLTVSASDSASSYMHTVAVSAGVGSQSTNFAFVDVDPTVTASIGASAHVTVTDGITVEANATPVAQAEVTGVSVGVGAGLGVSWARANTNVDVSASVGDNSVIHASSLAVTATLDLPGGTNPKNAYASAVAGGGGILLGAQGAVASTQTSGTVAASIGNNVYLPDGDVTVTGFNHSQTQSDATGVGIGFIGIGVAVANATSDVATSATIGTGANMSTTRDGALTISAHGNSTTVAASTAGSGGVVAGNGSSANAADNSTASASIGATGNTIHASDVTVASENDAYYFAHSDSTNAAVLGASGAFAEFDGNTSSTTTLPDNLTIAATGVVEISSANNYYSVPGGSVGEATDNVDAAGGGGISATAAFSTTDITGHSTVNIGNNLNISAINEPETDKASIGIDAGSQLVSNDFIKLETGGAIDGAGVNSSLTGHLYSSVNIGTGANLYSTQNIGVGTYTIVVGNLEADSSTWGLAAVGFSDAHLNVDTHETVNLGSGAQLLGLGNVNIRTGDDSTGHYQTSLTGTTSAQSYVRGLIAVPAADASTYFDSNQQTNIFGATIHSGRNTSIGADPHNPVANADGTGHGYELGFIPVTDGSSDTHANVTADVNFNGTAVAGFYHELTLNIADNGSAGGGFSGTDAVSQNADSVPVSFSYDPSFNPRDFVYNAPGGDKVNNGILVQYLQMGTVGAIHLGDLFAAAGNVIVDARNVTGSGSLEAHGKPTITVTNDSKDYLIIDGTSTIPFSTGGHVVLTGGASGLGGISKSENDVDVGGLIQIHNTYGGTYGSPATGPGLIVAGEVSNLGGLVELINDQGSIIVTNAIYAQNVSVSAPNGAFAISFTGTAVLGAAPMSEWDNVVNYPGGNPHTALDISSLNPNAAIAYVANSEHPGYGSMSALMYALLGNSASADRAYGLSGGPSLVYLGDDVPLWSGTSDQTANANISPVGSAYTWQDQNDPHSYFPNIPLETLTVTRAAGDWTGANASTAGHNDPQDPNATHSQIVAGTAVLISAATVDLNTHIEVGPPTDWSVSLPSSLVVPVFGGLLHVDLNTYRSMWQSGLVSSPVIDLPVDTINLGDALVTASFDARSGEINLENVKASGGSGIVRIKGALVNTNDLGNIQVNGGLGHVTIDNQTSIPLAVEDIYAGSAQAANASTSIVDLLDTNTNVQTMYTFRPGHGINVYTGSLDASMDDLRNGSPTNQISGNTTEFDPQAGWRLEWQLQATLTRNVDTSTNRYHADNWVFATPNDPNNPWQFYNWGTGQYQSADLPDSTLIRNVSDTNQFDETISGTSWGGAGITIDYFNYDGFTNNVTAHNDQDNKDEPASEHSFYYPDHAQLTLTMSVRADNPVGITFAGHDRGLIDITSNATVFLDGTLTNPSGDTNVTVTNGSISLPTSQSMLALKLLPLFGGGGGNSTPPILTNNLDLSASGGIGSTSDPIAATLTPGGILDATSGADGIHLVLGSGALIDSVSAGSSGHYGDVSISAAGSLLSYGSGTNVSGRDITLTTTVGTIGTIGDPLVIAAHATPLANGGFSHGFVTADAPGDVALEQVGGDLVVNSIRSEGGDVYIDVTNGGIYDQRAMTPAQLLSESDAGVLWSRLRLTAAFGVDAMTGETVTAFEGQVDRNYQLYWNLLDNGSVSGGTFTLDADKLDLYRAQASAKLGHDATDDEVQAYANDLYQTLDGFFVATIGAGYAATAPFTTFDANYSYVATSTQSDDLKRNAAWTDSELKYFVNRTALEPAAGTPVPPTQPNIFGNDVTLHAYGSVGKLAAPVSISISDIQNGTLTDEQAAALALAAAPGDVTFVGLDAFSHVVTFSYTGSHTLPPYVVTLTGIQVKELAPFFVAATGTFDATSDHGAVFVQSTAADLNLGYVSAATDASLIAPQDILSAGTNPSLQIHTGHDLSLLAGAGDIAASNTSGYTPLEIQVGGTLVSAGAGHVLDIEEITGDLRFQRLASGADSFVSVPNGSLLQVADGIGVGADNLTIDSQTDIGSSTQFVTILLETPNGRLYADAGGDVYIDGASGTVNPNGDLNVGHVFSSGGDVTLEADGSILNPDASGSNASVHGNTISLTTQNGSVGGVGHDLLVDSGYSGAGVVNAAVASGDIYLIETLGDLYLGTVTVDPDGGPHTAHFVAATGDIRNGLGSGINVTADKLWLDASGAIGTVSNSVTTAVGDIDARASAGGIYIDQYGGVRIGHVLDNHDAQPPQGLSATGDIVFTAHSPITVDEDVIAGGSITLTSVDSVLDDLITVSAGVTVQSTGSTVSILSGDGVWQRSGSTIESPTQINIEVDHNSTDPGVGGNAQLDGTLIAPLIVVSGNADPDTLTLHPDFVDGHVQMFGGGGSDLLVVDQMPSLDLAHKLDLSKIGAAQLNTGAPFGARNTVDLDGQAATDNYVVNTTGTSDYIVNVLDSGAPDDGADVLTINGTDQADVFLIRANFVARLPSTTATDPNTYVERINYNENINGRLIVNGLAGNDSFYSDDNSSITTLDGGVGDDFFQIGQVFGSARDVPNVAGGDQIATIFTTKGYLSRGISFPMVVYGGTGDDTFQVYSDQAELRLDGNAGDDTFIVRAFALADESTGKPLKDLSVAAQTSALGGDGNDLIQYSVNAPVDVDGGSGFNRMVVLGTEFDDNFVIESDGIFGAGLHITYANVQSITVDGLEGNDNFFVLSTPAGVAVNVVGGLGSDTFNIGGDVTLPIVARDLEGTSATINHQVTSGDPTYDNLPAEGVALHVASATSGQIVVTESGGSTVVSEQGETTDTFTYSLADVPTADVYLTVSAALAPSDETGADTVLVSVDGGATYQRAGVITFAAGTAAGTTRTVIVKAVDDAVAEGDRLYMVNTSSRSDDSRFNHVAVRNVKALVLDNDQPGLRITQTDGDTVVLEGAAPQGITDSYSLALAMAPESGKEVTVGLDPTDPRLQLTSADSRYNATTRTFTFNSTDWYIAATVNVAATDDGIVENPVTAQIVHLIGGTDTNYTDFYATPGNSEPQLNVKVLDTDGAGVYVRQTDGSTLVVKGDPLGDTYSLRLTHAPEAGKTVTIAFQTDDQTLVSSAVTVPPGGPLFADAVLDGSGHLVNPATVTFDDTNWFTPFVVRVTANPDAPPTDAIQPLKKFEVQPHVVSTAIQGPLSIDGSVGPEDRSIKNAVILPTEADPGPIGSSSTTGDETASIDTLNVFNDGSGANDVGTLTGSNLFLDGMGPDLHFTDSHGGTHDFAKGITYANVETVEVMLGRGDDNLTIDGTMASTDGTRGPLTIVHGGGGSDTIIINDGGGAASPLVVFGDTTTDGSRYSGVSGTASVNAIAFNNPGNDTIDARNDTKSVTIYGGAGDDTIWGSQAGDQIFGGSGNDTIDGQGGDDIIYGDDGINMAYATITIPDPNEDSGTINRTLYVRDFVIATTIDTTVPQQADTLAPGNDTINGGDGNDIVFGDYGIVAQPDVSERVASVADVLRAYTVNPASGSDDTIYGDAGDDVLIGGVGNDAIDGGLGKDLIFGDNVQLDRSSTYGDPTNPRFRALSGAQIYSTTAATMGQALVDTAWQQDPNGPAAWTDFRITLEEDVSGNDYIAGGGGDDQIFGQLGNDVIQGDGSIDIRYTQQTGNLLPTGIGFVGALELDSRWLVGAARDGNNALIINPSRDNYNGNADGSDYIEGGGGNDTIFGNQGQDDIVGGNSDLFSLALPAARPDGSNMIFGGSGTAISLNDPGATGANAQAHDSDAIVANNGDIFRLVGTNGVGSGSYLQFNYDVYGNPGASERIVPRAVTLLDYTPGGPDYAGTAGPLVAGDIGQGSEIHGEAGNDFIYGGPGNDVIFGDGQDDSIVGGYGADWISGGTGDDGILGDDGRIFSSRVSASVGEPLYGIAPVAATNQVISDLNDALVATINVVDPSGIGKLTYTAELTPDNLDPNHAAPNVLFRPQYANDIIYGGLGNDSIHGGAGDDAISGAEALPLAYTTNYDQNGVQIGTITESDFYHPYNPGNPLGYNPATTKFALYDAADPLRKILLNADGTLNKNGTGVDWILNFDQTQGPIDQHWAAGTAYAAVATDGDDRIFGDLGNDWQVGGTGRDTMYGGWGDDLLNADDNLNTTTPDTNPSYEDYAFGGAGRDVLIANTGGDRLIDWVGEFNTFLVPFSPFGAETVNRLPQPALQTFLLQLSQDDGADPWVGINHGGTAARNGEPYGELGMVIQGDSAWKDQTGGPRDPQPGNSHGSRDVRVSAGTLPIWQLAAGPAPTVGEGDATLTAAQLAPIVDEAKLLWTGALGTNDPHLAALDGVTVQVGSLPDGALGETTGKSILVDGNAAGWGWFVDPTPQDSGEFPLHLANGALGAAPGSPAYGHMDLLSTVLHEMGNAMGFPEDAGATGAVTSLYLSAGERLLPGGTDGGGARQQGTAPAGAMPGFDTYAGDGGIGAAPTVDWKTDANDGWSVALSPYDAGKPAKGGSNIAQFDMDLLAKQGNAKQGAEFDSLGRALLGKEPGR